MPQAKRHKLSLLWSTLCVRQNSCVHHSMLLPYFLAGRRCHLEHLFADKMWKYASKAVLSMAKKIKHFLRSCSHPLIILSKNDSGMTWNAIFSSFPVRTGMASEWLKDDLKCHFSSFLGMTGMSSQWWFDSFNAHSYHSCQSWFFCYIHWWWAMGKMRNDVEWMTKFDHFP